MQTLLHDCESRGYARFYLKIYFHFMYQEEVTVHESRNHPPSFLLLAQSIEGVYDSSLDIIYRMLEYFSQMKLLI
jgi:hypothetical protein